MPLRFRYRYVPFGTDFEGATGLRTEARQSPNQLYENELAVDVGGACWGLDGEERPVIDHHFFHAARYPSASAGVLHVAERIRQRFGSLADGDFWLVTHQHPDFDALCAMYLARCVLTGTIDASGWEQFGLRPDGWNHARDEIRWFKPEMGNWPAERRWPVLLAAYASYIDNCMGLVCPRSRSLHSVLYAAIQRGRPYLTETSGAVPFFDEVREVLSRSEQGMNPLYDSVLDSSVEFAPELAFLDTQLESYQQDIRRSRRTVVLLHETKDAFDQWYPKLVGTPLFTAGQNRRTVQPAHLAPPGHEQRQADGIFLRDPKCLLFKEWVRDDLDNSPLGKGFLFTAIAYSNGRPDAPVNKTEYFFALDPERAAGAHLYDVWSRLQEREVAGRGKLAADGVAVPAGEPRPGYEGRAGDPAAPAAKLFHDPWFDGSNYRNTIVATPNWGSAVGPAGMASDLSDDPVAQIVREELELRFFRDDFTVQDLSSSAGKEPEPAKRVSVGNVMQGQVPRLEHGSWRLARINLSEGIDLVEGVVAEQIGRLLWQMIDVDGGSGVPSDFAERHLIRKANWVGVWSRQGIVMAMKPNSAAIGEQLDQVCRKLSQLSGEVDALSRDKGSSAAIVDRSDDLVRRVAQLSHELTLPQNLLVRRFFESSRLDEFLRTVRDLNAAAQQQQVVQKMDSNLEHMTLMQVGLHMIERVVVVYYFIMVWDHLFKTKGYEHALEEINEHLPGWLGWLTYIRWDFFAPIVIALVTVELVNRYVHRLFHDKKH